MKGLGSMGSEDHGSKVCIGFNGKSPMNYFLRNYWANFKQTLLDCSLDDSLSDS